MYYSIKELPKLLSVCVPCSSENAFFWYLAFDSTGYSHAFDFILTVLVVVLLNIIMFLFLGLPGLNTIYWLCTLKHKELAHINYILSLFILSYYFYCFINLTIFKPVFSSLYALWLPSQFFFTSRKDTFWNIFNPKTHFFEGSFCKTSISRTNSKNWDVEGRK